MENSFLAIFDEIWPKTLQGLWPYFGATLKIHKKFNFDWNQLKLSTQHKNMYMYQKKIIKVENSLLAIFDKILCTIIRVALGQLFEQF